MSTIKLDSYTIKNRCLPRIDDMIETLNNAKKHLAYNSLPTDFKYRNTLESLIDSINSCINNLKNVKNYLNNNNSSFDRTLQDITQDVQKLPTKIVSRR